MKDAIGTRRCIRGAGKREAHLLGRVLVWREPDDLAGHLVDGLDDLEHLIIGDEAIAVDIIQLECP